MKIALIIVSVLCVVFFAIAVFLGTEMLKKFEFMRDFTRNTNQLVTWRHNGYRQPGMYNIVLRGKKPFCVLIGFQLVITELGHVGYDHYGFLCSGNDSVVAFSTYLGKHSCNFQFLVSADLNDNPIVVTSSEDDQKLVPREVYPSHWYQRLGF